MDGDDEPEGGHDPDDDERRQRVVKAACPDDDQPSGLTVRQAAAVLRLVSAAVHGHDVRRALADVEHALTLAITTATLGPGVMAGDLNQAWADVDAWPVPPPGPPRPQRP